MSDLTEKRCIPCEGGQTNALTKEQAEKMMQQLEGWTLNYEAPEITKALSFKNFYKTMSFVNAVAFIANNENHHPDLCVGFNYCTISLKTHAISGLSENDFIVAAKIDALERL